MENVGGWKGGAMKEKKNRERNKELEYNFTVDCAKDKRNLLHSFVVCIRVSRYTCMYVYSLLYLFLLYTYYTSYVHRLLFMFFLCFFFLSRAHKLNYLVYYYFSLPLLSSQLSSSRYLVFRILIL